jgi:hypothetical protein
VTKKAASIWPASRACTACSPPRSSTLVGRSNTPLDPSSSSARARVPLPSAPTASRRPASSLRRRGGRSPRAKIQSGSKNTLASETSSGSDGVTAEPVPPWTKAMSTPFSGSRSSRKFSIEPEVWTISRVTPSRAKIAL